MGVVGGWRHRRSHAVGALGRAGRDEPDPADVAGVAVGEAAERGVGREPHRLVLVGPDRPGDEDDEPEARVAVAIGEVAERGAADPRPTAIGEAPPDLLGGLGGEVVEVEHQRGHVRDAALAPRRPRPVDDRGEGRRAALVGADDVLAADQVER